MRFGETDGSSDHINCEEAVAASDPRCMTSAQLRRLGMPWLAYLRCGTIDGQPAYAIHAADGTAVAVVEDIALALELASEHDMTFVAVH
jgi:hypothetical protein